LEYFYSPHFSSKLLPLLIQNSLWREAVYDKIGLRQEQKWAISKIGPKARKMAFGRLDFCKDFAKILVRYCKDIGVKLFQCVYI
jgi:hypothetical protein